MYQNYKERVTERPNIAKKKSVVTEHLGVPRQKFAMTLVFISLARGFKKNYLQRNRIHFIAGKFLSDGGLEKRLIR